MQTTHFNQYPYYHILSPPNDPSSRCSATAVLIPPTTPRTLALSPKEAPLSKLLVGAAQEIGRDKSADDCLLLCFIGSLACDKLLSIGSVDIGGGINDVNGCNLATRLWEYIGSNMKK